MLKMDDTDEGRLTVYKHFLRRALDNVDASKIIVIVQEAENFGEMMEDELIAHPPRSTSWIFLSSMPLKVILSRDSCGSTYTNLHFDSGHTFFLPLPKESISSCDKKKEEIIKFLRQVKTFEDDGPSTFWEAYSMEMTKTPISEWIKRALADYGLLSVAVMDLFRATQADFTQREHGQSVSTEGNKPTVGGGGLQAGTRKGRTPAYRSELLKGQALVDEGKYRDLLRIGDDGQTIYACINGELVTVSMTAQRAWIEGFEKAFKKCKTNIPYKSETWKISVSRDISRMLRKAGLFDKQILILDNDTIKINPKILKGLPRELRDPRQT
jgi:hypothetical protein